MADYTDEESYESQPRTGPSPALVCSFCGKSQQEVKKLIAGPSVYICDECIALCSDIITEEAAPAERPSQRVPEALLTVGDLKAQAARFEGDDVPEPLRIRLAEALAAIEAHLRR